MIESAQAQELSQGVTCPACHQWLPARGQVGDRGKIVCDGCGWRGWAGFYDPLPCEVKTAEAALPEDARCVYHPTKKAAAICAGTGDYICSLCAIDVDGRTYGAAYVDKHGRAKLGQYFDHEMPRPDRIISNSLIFSVILPWLAPILLPIAGFQWRKMVKQRRANEAYRQMVGATTVVLYGVILGLLILAVAVVGVSLVVYWVS